MIDVKFTFDLTVKYKIKLGNKYAFYKATFFSAGVVQVRPLNVYRTVVYTLLPVVALGVAIILFYWLYHQRKMSYFNEVCILVTIGMITVLSHSLISIMYVAQAVIVKHLKQHGLSINQFKRSQLCIFFKLWY